MGVLVTKHPFNHFRLIRISYFDAKELKSELGHVVNFLKIVPQLTSRGISIKPKIIYCF